MFLVQHSLDHQLSLLLLRLLWLKHLLTWNYVRHQVLKVAAVLVIVVGLQFAYPHNFALPQARMAGEYVGLHPKGSITRTLVAQSQKDLTINTTLENFQVAPAQVGVEIDSDATIKKITAYSWRERLVPFSWFFTRRNITAYELHVNEVQLETFATSLTQKNRAPIDAAIKFESNTAVATSSETGVSFELEKTKDQLRSARVQKDLVARVEPTTVSPAIDTAAAQSVTANVNQRLAKPMKIDALDTNIQVDAATMVSWMVVTPDPENHTFKVEFDRTKIKSKLLSLAGKVYIAESPNRITLVDGETNGSAPGESGQALVLDASIDEVISAANAGSTSVTAKVQAVEPNTQIVRTYTKSTKGLQSLVSYWAQTHGGKYGITLKDVSGSIVASHNGNVQFTSASIYKMYLAYVVYGKVESGSMSLSEATSIGSNVGTCIDAMIVRSDNTCAVALGNSVGWQSNNALLHAKGYGSTSLVSGNHLTTSNNTTDLLMNLYKGSFNNAEHRAALLSMMNRQIYRSGIPAGSKGSSVANKVGFLDGLNHDAAIIYHPKGTYVLTVLSSGSSFAQISDLAKQISDVMNQ